MDLGLGGKVALVCGASRGLGRACAQRMAEEGASLAICARHVNKLEQAAREIEADCGVDVLPIVADQSRRQDVERTVWKTLERFGRIDILITNTSGPPVGPALDFADEPWEQAFQTLLMSVVRLCRSIVPAMREQGGGAIVCNTSFTAREPDPGMGLSNVFRAGILAFDKTLSRELAADGIRVNCVCPGPFDTERMQELTDRAAKDSGAAREDITRRWTDRVPLGRLLDPQELAGLVAFLCSLQASGITGTAISVDGGLLHGL